MKTTYRVLLITLLQLLQVLWSLIRIHLYSWELILVVHRRVYVEWLRMRQDLGSWERKRLSMHQLHLLLMSTRGLVLDSVPCMGLLHVLLLLDWIHCLIRDHTLILATWLDPGDLDPAVFDGVSGGLCASDLVARHMGSSYLLVDICVRQEVIHGDFWIDLIDRHHTVWLCGDYTARCVVNHATILRLDDLGLICLSHAIMWQVLV